MNENLYNLFIEKKVLTHGIGEINEEETYYKFNSILKLGGLYSKNKLVDLGLNFTGRVTGNIRTTSEDWISLFDPTLPKYKKRMLSSHYQYFLPFHPNVIFFLIDFSVESELESSRVDIDESEVKVKDYISLDSCKGILVPNEANAIEIVSKLMQKHSCDLPLYDFEGSILGNNQKLK